MRGNVNWLLIVGCLGLFYLAGGGGPETTQANQVSSPSWIQQLLNNTADHALNRAEKIAERGVCISLNTNNISQMEPTLSTSPPKENQPKDYYIKVKECDKITNTCRILTLKRSEWDSYPWSTNSRYDVLSTHYEDSILKANQTCQCGCGLNGCNCQQQMNNLQSQAYLQTLYQEALSELQGPEYPVRYTYSYTTPSYSSTYSTPYRTATYEGNRLRGGVWFPGKLVGRFIFRRCCR